MTQDRRSRFRFWLVWSLVVISLLLGAGYWFDPFSLFWPTISGDVALPMQLPSGTSVRVLFTPTGESSKTFPAYATAPGLTFTVRLPPGPYKVTAAVGQWTPGGGPKGEGSWEPFFELAGPISPPLRYEVTRAPRQVITVNLGKSPGGPNR